jgi:phosphoribosyl 1,2-cyclic phosphodiesterase
MPLDHVHGVDAFIEFTDKNGNTYRVTLDETVRQQKLDEGHKADIVFAPLPDAVKEQDQYLAEIDQLADDAMSFFVRNIKQDYGRKHNMAA